MEDKHLKCVDCGADFVFTADEQKFHQEKGYRNEPKRCTNCRQNRRQNMGGGGGYRERERFEVTCAECGQKTTVPFKPVLDKPVYCNACYAKVKQSR